jgi:nicotinamide-nucleotide amidase
MSLLPDDIRVKAEAVLDAFRIRGLKLATAESCTGGLVMAALTDIPGSSDVIDRGWVTYSNESKLDELNVSGEILETFGSVSEAVAWAMAEGAIANSDADRAIAVTGIAGPAGSEHKPVGLVCFGLGRRGQKTLTETRNFGDLGRDQVRLAAVRAALDLLRPDDAP